MTGAELNLILILAQTCAAEVGFTDWSEDSDECVLMWEINDRNSKIKKPKRSLATQTKLYNSYWKYSKENRPRPWIAYLNYEGSKPKYWPKKLKWSNHMYIWLNYLHNAEKFVKERRQSTYKPKRCALASEYGGKNERPKGKYVQVNCGNTKQRYWVRRKLLSFDGIHHKSGY